jgi:hypothetical protein
MHEKLGADF